MFGDAIRISIFERVVNFQRYADFRSTTNFQLGTLESLWCSIFKIFILKAWQVSEVSQVLKVALKIAHPFVSTFKLFKILLLLSDRTKQSQRDATRCSKRMKMLSATESLRRGIRLGIETILSLFSPMKQDLGKCVSRLVDARSTATRSS